MKTRYGFSDGINGFFEFPTENARRILPSHLEPVELHHGSSILAMTAFNFTQSEVGPYGEVVMAVIVAPLVTPGERLPKAAYYPYIVATTTKASRDHAIQRWHLPHWMQDVEIRFERESPIVTVRVRADAEPLADLTIAEHSWAPASFLYQSVMKDEAGAYVAHMLFEGELSEHEDEKGRIVLYDHPFHKGLEIAEVSDVPFRETWMRNGVQTFDPLIQLATV